MWTIAVLLSVLIGGGYVDRALCQECPGLGLAGQELCLKVVEASDSGPTGATFPIGAARLRGPSPIVIDAVVGAYDVDLQVDLVTGLNMIAMTVSGQVRKIGAGNTKIVLTADGGLSPVPLARRGQLILTGSATGTTEITFGAGAGYDIGVGEPQYTPFPRVIQVSLNGGGRIDAAEIDQPLPDYLNYTAIEIVASFHITNTGDSIDLERSGHSGISLDPPVTPPPPSNPPQPRPLWRPFWFLDGKIMLHPGNALGYAYTGFWGGWYPYHYYYNYYYPWYGPVSCHPCCWPMRWHYWWWDWPWKSDCYYSHYSHQGCWWWWHPWGGGPHFWGFLNRLTYLYGYPDPRATYWWSWYWIHDGKGRCLEVVTLSDEQRDGLVLPLDNAVLENLYVEDHIFHVNGGATYGYFAAPSGEGVIERVRVHDLLGRYVELGASEEDILAFQESDIYLNLVSNSGPDDEVLVQVGEFTLPEHDIRVTQSDYSTEVKYGQADSYEISLLAPSEYPTTVTASPQVNGEKIDLGLGVGEPITLRFPPGYTGPRTITVSVPEGDLLERDELAVVAHTMTIQDVNHYTYDTVSVPVALMEAESGYAGHLAGDFNSDGVVNFIDLSWFGLGWLESDDRVCSLDQSSFWIIKCWGKCPNKKAKCYIRWRRKGSTDPWTISMTNFRNRDKQRDAGLEYSCICR